MALIPVATAGYTTMGMAMTTAVGMAVTVTMGMAVTVSMGMAVTTAMCKAVYVIFTRVRLRRIWLHASLHLMGLHHCKVHYRHVCPLTTVSTHFNLTHNNSTKICSINFEYNQQMTVNDIYS